MKLYSDEPYIVIPAMQEKEMSGAHRLWSPMHIHTGGMGRGKQVKSQLYTEMGKSVYFLSYTFMQANTKVCVDTDTHMKKN